MAAEDKGLTFTPLLHGTIDDAGVRAVVEVPRRALAALDIGGTVGGLHPYALELAGGAR